MNKTIYVIIICFLSLFIIVFVISYYIFSNEYKSDTQCTKYIQVEQCAYKSTKPNLRYHGVIKRKVTIKGLKYTYKRTVKFKWYSSKIAYHYLTPSLYVDKYGFYRGKSDNLLRCACSKKLANKGAIIYTPWGKAKVFDTGCAYGVVDMYVKW